MPRGEVRELFGGFTRVFDYKWYGQEPTTRVDYEGARALAARICTPPESTSTPVARGAANTLFGVTAAGTGHEYKAIAGSGP